MVWLWAGCVWPFCICLIWCERGIMSIIAAFPDGQLAKLPDPQADHPQVEIPFSVCLEGQKFRGRHLSLVAAHIQGPCETHLLGHSRLVRLEFSLPGFTVALEMDATILPSDRDFHTTKLVFLDPTGAHLPQLRHILDAYIAQDLKDLGSVLHIAQTSPTVATALPAPTQPWRHKLRKSLRWAGVACLTVLLISLLASRVFDRFYVYDLPAPGLVMQQGQTLRAIADGQINHLNTDAKAGEVAFSIWATSGDMFSVSLPCACRLRGLGLTVGATVLKGDAVMHMSRPEAPVEITAQVPSAQLTRFASGTVEITLPNGTQTYGRASASALQAAIQMRADPATLAINPEISLPPSTLGQPVDLRLILPMPGFLQTLLDLKHQLRPQQRTPS